MMTGQKARICIGIFIDTDAEHDKIRHVVMKLDQGRQFSDARLAPGSPEVEQHDLAAIVG